jgi:hypothetical protein
MFQPRAFASVVLSLLTSCATSTPDKWERLDGRCAHEGTVKIAIANCQDAPEGGVEECMKRWGYKPAKE